MKTIHKVGCNCSGSGMALYLDISSYQQSAQAWQQRSTSRPEAHLQRPLSQLLRFNLFPTSPSRIAAPLAWKIPD
jgi:hypothetical protein